MPVRSGIYASRELPVCFYTSLHATPDVLSNVRSTKNPDTHRRNEEAILDLEKDGTSII